MRIEIPALAVRAPIMRLGRNSDGAVQVPPFSDHNLAGWYVGSVTPGQAGSPVILGHVDSYAGPSAFFSIKNLLLGDEIDVVRADGAVAVFAVDGVQKVAKVGFPASAVYGNVPYPSLRLVTCGGPFDAGRGQYLDNIVVMPTSSGRQRADPPPPPRGSTLISRYCKLDADGSTKTGTREAQDDDREQLRQPRDDRGGRYVARDIPP